MEIHEFLDIYGEDIEEGIITEECMEMACEFLIEMACADITAVRTILSKLYIHLLKYQYQPAKQSKLWVYAIRDRAIQLSDFMQDEFLRKKITFEMQEDIYEHALKRTKIETRLPEDIFPQSLPKDFCMDYLIDIDCLEQYLRKYACSE